MSALGVLGLVGNLGGSGIEAYGASLQSHKARRFAREMMSTQYQTAVRDMRAAGLNPNAIFGSGGGSTPGMPVGMQSNIFEGAGELGDQVAKSFTRGDEAVALKAQADIARSNARAAESDADLKLAENSAYMKALSTDGGKLGAIEGRYGKLGAAGEVMGNLGLGNVLGGEASAKSVKRREETRDEVNAELRSDYKNLPPEVQADFFQRMAKIRASQERR